MQFGHSYQCRKLITFGFSDRYRKNTGAHIQKSVTSLIQFESFKIDLGMYNLMV